MRTSDVNLEKFYVELFRCRYKDLTKEDIYFGEFFGGDLYFLNGNGRGILKYCFDADSRITPRSL